MKELKRIALDGVDTVVKMALERVWEWSKQITDIPWLSGVIVRADLVSGDNEIAHKLGRTPRGMIVLGLEAATADELPSIVSRDDRFMVINAANPSTVTLWVWG